MADHDDSPGIRRTADLRRRTFPPDEPHLRRKGGWAAGRAVKGGSRDRSHSGAKILSGIDGSETAFRRNGGICDSTQSSLCRAVRVEFSVIPRHPRKTSERLNGVVKNFILDHSPAKDQPACGAA